MSEPAIRRSPVRFDRVPSETRERGGWRVVVAYRDEGTGPWLVDLSHRARWDLQDRAIGDRRPFGVQVPDAPGEVNLERGLLIARLNRTQASIGHVGPEAAPAPPADIAFTDTTDSHAWLAVVGEAAPAVLESISNLDLFPPPARRRPPFLTQGPMAHVPCQVVTLAPDCALIAFARGWTRSFVEALLDAGADCGLEPAGERRFTGRFEAGS